MSTYNIEMNLLNSSSSYDTLYPKVNLSNSQGTLPASQISSGTFGAGDYTIPGNLILKGNGNFGTKLNLGDGDYVHISEPTDDCLEIKGKKINFVTTDTSSSGLTWNNSAIGGNSDSTLIYESGSKTGTGSNHGSQSSPTTYVTFSKIQNLIFFVVVDNQTSYIPNTWAFLISGQYVFTDFIGNLHSFSLPLGSGSSQTQRTVAQYMSESTRQMLQLIYYPSSKQLKIGYISTATNIGNVSGESYFWYAIGY